MNVDQLVRHLAQCRARIKQLRDDNQRIWESRERWKRAYADRAKQNTALRKKVARLERSRDLWRSRAPKKWTRSGVPIIELRPGDLERILEIEPRK